jgi:GNAT superfamily N-acetyltransferase
MRTADFDANRSCDAEFGRHIERDIASQSTERIDEFLFWARSGEQLNGVVWAHATSRMTVTIVPPRLAQRTPADVGERLLTALLGDVAQRSGGAARCGVVLMDDEAEADASVARAQSQLLTSAGFEYVTTVEFLLTTVMVSEPASPIAILRAGQVETEHFAQTLRMTTTDGTDGSPWVRWRRVAGLDLEEDDIETSGSGECYFVQHTARTVGVLVLAPARTEDDVREVQYLGILPSERRRGYAVATLRAVQQLAARQGRFVTASVDSAQIAAVRAYHRAGFRPWCRRRLWARRIDTN